MTGDILEKRRCEKCRKVFFARKDQVKIGRARWCSPHCYNKSRSKANRIKKDFWKKVNIGREDLCWEWMGSRCNGYGMVRINGKTLRAHRVSFVLSGNKIPKGKIIRHVCDNPPCCNPKHLLMGTQKENVQDAVDRGRWFKNRKQNMKNFYARRRK